VRMMGIRPISRTEEEDEVTTRASIHPMNNAIHSSYTHNNNDSTNNNTNNNTNEEEPGVRALRVAHTGGGMDLLGGKKKGL
jgi:hypothetical protein